MFIPEGVKTILYMGQRKEDRIVKTIDVTVRSSQKRECYLDGLVSLHS